MSQATLETLITTFASHQVHVGPMGQPTYTRDTQGRVNSHVDRMIEELSAILEEYARVPIAFRVERQYRLECVQQGLGGLALIEEEVVPYVKDYDALSGGPLGWQQRWDMSQGSFRLLTRENGGSEVPS